MTNYNPEWVNHPSVQDADAELNESLKASPFVGLTAMNALAQFIKATDTLRHSSNGKITPAESISVIVDRISAAQTAAEQVPDPTYAQMFNAQKVGFEALTRTTTRRTREPKAPRPTKNTQMSGAKS